MWAGVYVPGLFPETDSSEIKLLFLSLYGIMSKLYILLISKQILKSTETE